MTMTTINSTAMSPVLVLMLNSGPPNWPPHSLCGMVAITHDNDYHQHHCYVSCPGVDVEQWPA